MSNESTRAPESGPFVVDYCHGMVGGPAVIGPTGVHGFMQGPENDRKAEALCARLNAAWAELGDTVEFLRAKRVELEARIAEVLEADRKTRDEFIEAWKAKEAAEARVAAFEEAERLWVEQFDEEHPEVSLTPEEEAAVAEVRQIADVAVLRGRLVAAETAVSARDALLRRAGDVLRDVDVAVARVFWTSDDGETQREGEIEDEDVPEPLMSAWRAIRTLLSDIESQVVPSPRREEESEK